MASNGLGTSVLNIYYDPTQNGYLLGQTYDFSSGSGQLISTPLPASVLLLGSHSWAWVFWEVGAEDRPINFIP